jgi:hypothetical protein
VTSVSVRRRCDDRLREPVVLLQPVG